MPLSALIFDLDGTLVDSNRAHIESWARTFPRFGYQVAPDRIAPEIGKGGDNLVPSILGDAAEARDGDAMREAAGTSFVEIVSRERKLALLPGARELLDHVRRRGLRSALATSSGERQLDAIFESVGVDLRPGVDVVVMKDDVERSKPDPDVIHAALAKLDIAPERCAMVGDTPHDVESARRAGVVTLGLSSGGFNDADVLRHAGAIGVWRDPAHLLAELDDAIRAATVNARGGSGT